MSKKLQILSQGLFLVLFAVLVVTGRVQLWMGIFLLSVLLALFLGRFYCGWVCPINTAMRVATGAKKRLKIKNFRIPGFFKNPAFRYGFLVIFIGTFSFVMATGTKLPVLPALFFLGIGLTLFFPENLWHRYLCPYGTILTLTGSRAKKGMLIDSDNCTLCGVCREACPSDAVNENEKEGYTIEKGLCLTCLDCAVECPNGSIHFN